MVYSNKFNNNINVSSYKVKSPTNFQKSDQKFEKGGIIYNDYVLGTKKVGTKNYRIRSNLELKNITTPYTRLSSSNLSDTQIRENIKLSSCHNEKHNLQNLQNQYNKNPTDSSYIPKIENAEIDLNKCIDVFMDSYKYPDKNITRVPSSNILPDSYPVKDQEIFGSNLQSCRDSQQYHDPFEITLPTRINNNKPKYGTDRGYDMIGPRVFDVDNINNQTKFNAVDSGYNVQDEEVVYNTSIVENYDDHEDIKNKNYCDNNKCNFTNYKYKNSENVYNGECGTKSNFGTISDKLDRTPQLSEFVKNNIIGNNFQHINRTSLYGRNKATFNNRILESSDLNLNTIRKESHSNYITNTNKLRDEFANNYFKQHSEKMMNNLNNRG
tara:strand:+ start:106 stop:1251 length:1146 start_codon:yes stop_codon:yes gene_type:complete